MILEQQNKMRMASRKGFEPLTPGLGNPCSILLSYRDITPRGTYTVLDQNRLGLTPCSESPSSIKSIELGNRCSILLSYQDVTAQYHGNDRL